MDHKAFRAQLPAPSMYPRASRASTNNLGPTVQAYAHGPDGKATEYHDTFVKHVHRTDPAQRVWSHEYRRGAYDVMYESSGTVSPQMQKHLDLLHTAHTPRTAHGI